MLIPNQRGTAHARGGRRATAGVGEEKAEEDTEEGMPGIGRRHTSRAEKVRNPEKRLEEEERKVTKSARNQSTVVAELNDRVAVLELEQDGVRLDFKKGRSSSSALIANPTKAKEDANAAPKVLKEEEPSFG